MTKIWLSILVSASMLSACGGAKSKIIPSDPQKWDQIADDVKSLSDDDRKDLVGYMGRMAIASAFSGGKGAIPPGTTIGEAISQQKDWEAKQQADEAQANVLKAQIDAQKAADAARIMQAATVAITGLVVLPQDVEAGRYSNRLNLDIAIQNKSAKQITGIKGVLDFKDQFGSEISKMRLSLDEDVLPGKIIAVDSYGKDLNKFEDDDQKLETIPFEKMHITFTPEMVVFADGSKIGASDDAK